MSEFRIKELEDQLLTANGAVMRLTESNAQLLTASQDVTRLTESNTQLLTANTAVTRLTESNAQLTKELADAELQNKKLRRNSRRDGNDFKQQLAMSQLRRG